MRGWSPTARRSGVGGLSVLLRRRDWAEAEGDVLRSALRPFLDDPDPVVRWFLARVVHLVERDPESALELIQARLAVEKDFENGGTLLACLGRYAAEHPEQVDRLLYDAAFGSWLDAFDDDDAQVDYAFADGFVEITLYLALVRKTAHARSLAQSWFEEPWDFKVCDRAIILTRRFLNDGGAEVRSGAFALLLLATKAAERRRAVSDSSSEEFRKAYEVVSSVCTTVHLVSDDVQDRRGHDAPAPADYLRNALPVFWAASAFREPSIVHDIVQTLAHLAPQDPAETLRCLRGVVDRGDPYSYDSLAQEATTALCARYLSEFWKDIADDDTLLTALREVLTVFVIAGHPPAIDLSRRLGDAFR